MSNTQQVQTGFAEVNGTSLDYEVAGTAHHPFLEKPAEFNQIVLDFLGSLQS